MSYNALRSASKISNVRLCRYDSSSAFYQVFEDDGDVGGWDLYNNVVMYGSWSGMLFGTASDRECYIGRSTSIVPINAEDYYLVHLMMKITNNNPDKVRGGLTAGRIAWTTISDGIWDDKKQIDFDLVVDNTWRLYEINMGPVSRWVGSINNFRVYPFVDANEGDHFAIKYIKVTSLTKWRCTNPDCSYYLSYEHNCPGTGNRGSCTSGVAKDSYSVTSEVDDDFVVNIDGYGNETFYLGTHTNVTGIEIARIISSLLSSSSIGGMAFSEVEWSYDTNFLKIYSGWYGSDSSVEVIDTPCARTLGFFDDSGNNLSTYTFGSDPVDGFDNKSARLLTAFEINKLIDGNLLTPSYIHQPSRFNLEGGRRDYNELSVRPDVDVSEAGTILYDNKYKTIVDVSHPFNNNGVLNYIHILGEKSTSTIGKVMVCRPYKTGKFKVIHSFDFEDKDPSYRYTNTPVAYVVECPVGTRVKKGDVLAVYNMDLYVAFNESGKPDASFYHVSGNVSGMFDPGKLWSYGISGFSLYGRGNRREDSIYLEIDLGKRVNIGEMRVYGSEYGSYCEYNIARCIDVNWDVDCYGLTHKHSGLLGGAQFVYYHPNIVYGVGALSDGKLTADQGLAGITSANSPSSIGIATTGEHSYCYCNGDAEWMNEEFPYPTYLGALTEEFKEDDISYILLFPRDIKCSVHRYAVHFKETDNFKDFELSYYLGPNDNTGNSVISNYYNRLTPSSYISIGINGKIYPSDTDNSDVKELFFNNPIVSEYKYEHGVCVNWRQVDAAARLQWTVLDYRFDPVDCYGFAITAMTHNSTKITEMEVYSSFDIEPSLIDNVICEFSDYKDIWLTTSFNAIDDEVIQTSIAGSPRYFNMELTSNTSFYINEIRLDVDEAVLLDRCGTGVFLDESKVNAVGKSSAVTLTNTYPKSCDLQVGVVKETFHTSDIVYWSKLDSAEEIASPKIGPGSYVKKSANYPVRNDEGQCAINCYAYGLNNLIHGKKAYAYENEYGWRYYDTLSSGVSIEYTNNGGGHLHTITIPPVSAKYWKLEQAQGPGYCDISSISFSSNGENVDCDRIYMHGPPGKSSYPRMETSFNESHGINSVDIIDHDFSTGWDGFTEVTPSNCITEWFVHEGGTALKYYDKNANAGTKAMLVKDTPFLSDSMDIRFKYKHEMDTGRYGYPYQWFNIAAVWLILYDADGNEMISVNNGLMYSAQSRANSTAGPYLLFFEPWNVRTNSGQTYIWNWQYGYFTSHIYDIHISIRGNKISASLTVDDDFVMGSVSNLSNRHFPTRIASIGVGFSIETTSRAYANYKYDDVIFYNLNVTAFPVIDSLSSFMWSFDRARPVDTIKIISDTLNMPVISISETDNDDYIPWCVEGDSFSDSFMYSGDLTIPWVWRSWGSVYVSPITASDSYNIDLYAEAGDSHHSVFGDSSYPSSYWKPDAGYPHWVGYDFGVGNERLIQAIELTHEGNNYATLFSVQGSNTPPSANRFDWSGKVWDTLATISGTGSSVFYSFLNVNYYRFYRLYGYESTADGGSGRWLIKELKFLESYAGVSPDLVVQYSSTYTDYFAIDLGKRHFLDIVRNVGPTINNDLFYISRANGTVEYSNSTVGDVNDVNWGVQGDFYDNFEDGWYEDNWVKEGTAGSSLLEQDGKIIVKDFGVGSGLRGPTLTHYFGKEIESFDFNFGINCFHTGSGPTQGNGNYVYIDFIDDTDNIKIRILLYGYDNGTTKYIGSELYDKSTKLDSWTTGSYYNLSDTNIVNVGRDVYTAKLYYIVNGGTLYSSSINNDVFYKVRFTFLRTDTLPYYEMGLTYFEAFTRGYGDDVRWLRIKMICGDNVDKRLCYLGVYPDIKETYSKDGGYNCSWYGFGAQFTSYNEGLDIAFESTVTGTNNYWRYSYPELAVNGVSDQYDINSVWAFDNTGEDDPYLEMDLGSIHTVNRIVLHHSYDPVLYPYTNTSYRLDVSTSVSGTFATVLSVSSNSEYDVEHIFDPVDVRIARVVITSYDYVRTLFSEEGSDQDYEFVGNALRNVELYTYNHAGYVRSDDWPIVCINLRDYFDVQDHELLNLDISGGGTWCNEEKFFRYGDSILDDPMKVRFTSMGSDFVIYNSNATSGVLDGAYYTEYVFDTDVYFNMGRYQLTYSVYNPTIDDLIALRFEGVTSVESVATNIGSGWRSEETSIYIPQDGYYVIRGIVKVDAMDADWGVRYPIITRTFGRTKWVAVVRDTGATHVGETASTAAGTYASAGTDYLSKIRVFGDRKYSATEYYWWWQYRISTLSNDYLITHSGNRTLKITYPASSSLEVISFIEGDHFGIDPDWSIKDFFAFWMYVEDIDKLDFSDGYILFGKITHSPSIYYKWNLSNFVFVNGWNYVRCKFEFYDEIYPDYSDDVESPQFSGQPNPDKINDGTLNSLLDLRINKVNTSSFSIVFRGKGEETSIYLDDLHFDRNYYDDDVKFGKGLCLTGYDALEIPISTIDVTHGTIEFWAKFYITSGGIDHFGNYRSFNLFDICNSNNELISLGVNSVGWFEVNAGQIKEQLLFTIDDAVYWGPNDEGSVDIDDVVHIALVWDNSGRLMSNGDTMRFYINNKLMMTSKETWLITDTKGTVLRFGGSNNVYSYNGDNYGSCVFDNIKVYSYCKEIFYPNEEGVYFDKADEPNNYLEISADNIEFYGLGSEYLPLVFDQVASGGQVTFYVRSVKNEDFKKCLTKTGVLRAEWIAPV